MVLLVVGVLGIKQLVYRNISSNEVSCKARLRFRVSSTAVRSMMFAILGDVSLATRDAVSGWEAASSQSGNNNLILSSFRS